MPGQINKQARRRALRHAIADRVLWDGGNALSAGTPANYFVLDPADRGTALSMIVAAPAIAGLLRLMARWLLARRSRSAVETASFANYCGDQPGWGFWKTCGVAAPRRSLTASSARPTDSASP